MQTTKYQPFMDNLPYLARQDLKEVIIFYRPTLELPTNPPKKKMRVNPGKK